MVRYVMRVVGFIADLSTVWSLAAAAAQALLTWLVTKDPLWTAVLGVGVGVALTLAAWGSRAYLHRQNSADEPSNAESNSTERVGFRVHEGAKLRTINTSIEDQDVAFDVRGQVETHNTRIK